MSWNVRRWTMLLGLLVFALPAASRGDIVVSIGSATIAPGAPASIDVMFYSTASNTDFLDAYSIEFSITKTSSGVPATGLLYFDKTQYTAVRAGNDPPTNDGPNDPISPYIYGTSADTQAVTINQLDPAPLILDAADSADNAGVPAPAIPTILSPIGLIRLKLTTSGLLSTQAGDIYEINLVAANSVFIDLASPTGEIPFTSNTGIVTVAAAVPEPGTLGLAATGLLAGAGLWRWRRR